MNKLPRLYDFEHKIAPYHKGLAWHWKMPIGGRVYISTDLTKVKYVHGQNVWLPGKC